MRNSVSPGSSTPFRRPKRRATIISAPVQRDDVVLIDLDAEAPYRANTLSSRSAEAEAIVARRMVAVRGADVPGATRVRHLLDEFQASLAAAVPQSRSSGREANHPGHSDSGWVSMSERWTGHIGAPCDLAVG